MDKKREVPIEIDDHFKLFGKEPWEVEYGEKCPVCEVRIDEYGNKTGIAVGFYNYLNKINAL